jgi:hypothetical protein
MERLDLDLDPYVAIALGGEFEAPSDPIDRRHTPARLYWASLLKGEFDGDTATYRPIWAPVEVDASMGPQFDFTIYYPVVNTEDDKADTDFDQRIDAINERTALWVGATSNPRVIRLGGRSTGLAIAEFFNTEDMEENVAASHAIAGAFGNFFAQFEGWTRTEDGVWVPPTAQPAA